MAIQFFCVACRQPIEVDDEMANQTVTCPYCRKVVTAPAATEPAIQENPPIASPSDLSVHSEANSTAALGPQRTNIWSWISLGCVSFTLIVLAIGFGVGYSMLRELGPNPTREEISRQFNEGFAKRPGLQMLGTLGGCVTPILGVIFAIVALVRRTPPRWPAITALVVCGLFILLVCLNVLVAVWAAGGKPAA